MGMALACIALDRGLQVNVNNRRTVSIVVDNADSCAQQCLGNASCLSFVLYGGDAQTCDLYSKVWKWAQLIDVSADGDAANIVAGDTGALYCKHLAASARRHRLRQLNWPCRSRQRRRARR